MSADQSLNHLKLELWDIGDIHPYEGNAKIHTPDEVARLARAIKDQGWDVPIVVDKGGVIIKGHGRRLAAIELGMSQVPVFVRRDLSPAKARAARIADNRVAIGDIDDAILKSELAALMRQADVDLQALGFEEGEIDWDALKSLEIDDDLLASMDSPSSEIVDPERSDEGSGGIPKEVQYSKAFQVIVECENEADQESVYAKMTEEGYTCRVLSM